MSDEFTVPLCAIHHHHIHTTGNEREWWEERKTDPLTVASRLWQQSRERFLAVRAVGLAEGLQAKVDRGTVEPLSSNSGSDSAPTTPNPTDSRKREA